MDSDYEAVCLVKPLPKSPSRVEKGSWDLQPGSNSQLGYPGIDLSLPTLMFLVGGGAGCELLLTACLLPTGQQKLMEAPPAPGRLRHLLPSSEGASSPIVKPLPGSAACPSGHSCTKETVFPLELPCSLVSFLPDKEREATGRSGGEPEGCGGGCGARRRRGGARRRRLRRLRARAEADGRM